jgi:hypothetical protein
MSRGGDGKRDDARPADLAAAAAADDDDDDDDKAVMLAFVGLDAVAPPEEARLRFGAVSGVDDAAAAADDDGAVGVCLD